MALYLGTDGKMGECPDDYALVQSAKYLGCKPWELLEQPVYWKDRAIKFMNAEANGANIKQQRGQ